MRNVFSFISGLSVGLLILFFSLKAEKDSTKILYLRSEIFTLRKQIDRINQNFTEINTENQELKVGLNQCKILFERRK